MKKQLTLLLCCALVIGISSVASAAETQTLTVKATVPTLNGMSVAISKVVGTTWTTVTGTTLDFGTLTLDTTYHIFKADAYFAVDIGVLNNGTTAWTIQHTPSSIYNRTTGSTSQNLDSNINVTFVNQLTDSTANNISKVSFLNSSKSIAQSTIASGWLRIYYGLGTGSGDNTGVSPIAQTQAAGVYQGSVTLTLSP